MQHGLEIVDFGVHTLKNIHFTVSPGQCMGLSGPSGSGKSLLLRAIADLDPHQGQMRLDGIDADQIPPPQWRRSVGLLPAESAWWHDTVGPHFDETPGAWLGELGFDDSVMAWNVQRLSSGERQRLALLRLLSRRPNVLLLDEPTANLDRVNIRRVESVIVKYMQSQTLMTIWVSHDMDQLQRNCEPIFLVQGSRLIPLDNEETAIGRESA